MKIIQNYNLKKFNTFNFEVKAKYFVQLKKEIDLIKLFQDPIFLKEKILFLGGGSNVLFTKDFNGLVIFNKLKGISIIKENKKHVYIKAMGGEWWHDLVSFTVQKNFWGLENLSFIPGTAGAAPVQNIGAYGVELKDVLVSVEAYNLKNGIKKIFSKEECLFDYRDSIFKNKLKNKYFISAILIKLNKNKKINNNYQALKKIITEKKIKIKKSKDISDLIIQIRKSKLPNPKILPNAGSFFKNVYVSELELKKLKKDYPDIPFFKEGKKNKIPAGWLIEQCGWKGKRIGNIGIHKKQALVLINYGQGNGKELLNLAKQIIKSVQKKFNLKLIPEVNLF